MISRKTIVKYVTRGLAIDLYAGALSTLAVSWSSPSTHAAGVSALLLLLAGWLWSRTIERRPSGPASCVARISRYSL